MEAKQKSKIFTRKQFILTLMSYERRSFRSTTRKKRSNFLIFDDTDRIHNKLQIVSLCYCKTWTQMPCLCLDVFDE